LNSGPRLSQPSESAQRRWPKSTWRTSPAAARQLVEALCAIVGVDVLPGFGPRRSITAVSRQTDRMTGRPIRMTPEEASTV
jgi:hypothetical protein